MTPPDELLPLVDRILKLVGEDGSALERWRQTEDGQKVIQYVVQIGKYPTNIGQGKDISIGDRLDRSLLEEIRDLLKSQLTPPPPDIDWQQVSRSLLNEQIQRLTTNPLTHAEGITYRTEQVYVPLGLVERKKVSRRREDVSPEQGSLLYEETEITRKFEHEDFLKQVLRLGQSPRSGGRRIVVIGEPGAGKTTLLQQMAQWVAENIEGAIAIWVSLADLQGRSLEDYLLEQWLPAAVQQQGRAEASTQVRDAFVAQFRARQVWLLLDGVDEMSVTTGNPLGEIERQVRLGGLLGQARIVLTCRLNLWDGDRHALDRFDVYRTLEFAYPGQVEQFVGQWFGALPEAQAGQAERLCEALRQPGKERLRDLVKNPLRLTLLCFNWYLGEGTLPETKAGLYEQFVVDFYEWKRKQFPTTAEQRRQLNAALGELAREAIDKEETRFRLRHDFVCAFLGEPDEPGSLFQSVLQLGWLNKVGVEAENPRKAVYAFFHPTFQEYFAALAIKDWNYFMPRTHKNKPVAERQYRVFEAHWKEVILLWMGIEEKNNTQELKLQRKSFIVSLDQFKDNCHSFYEWQAFFLMAECISQAPNTDFFLEPSQILKYLVELGFSSFLSKRILSPIAEAAKASLYNTNRELTIRELIAFIRAAKYLREVEASCKYLALIGRGNQEAINSLLEWIKSAKDYWHLKAFLECIREIGVNNTIASAALENFLDSTQDTDAIWLTAHILRYIQRGNQKAAGILADISARLIIKSLENQEVRNVDRNDVLKSLTEDYLMSEEEQTQKLMSEHLQANKNSQTLMYEIEYSNDLTAQLNAAHELVMIAYDDSQVVNHLKQLLERSKNEFTILATAYCLGHIEPNNLKAISSLCHLLNNSKNPLLHKYAASILGEISQGDESAIVSLINLLNSTHSGGNFGEDILEVSANSLRNILRNEQLIHMTINLKEEFLKETTQRSFEKYEAYYKVIFHCAQNLPYPKFHQVWYS